MDILDAFLTRRTVRKYRPAPVNAAQVRWLLEAAMAAPSAADARPWQFVVVDRRDLLDRLESAMPHCEMLKTAALAVLVCADPSREKIPGFWPQDCAVATEHVHLAAHALGLGSCWIGIHPVPDREQAVRRILGVPENLMPFALVSIGAPDEVPGPDRRYDETRIHRNGW